MRFKVGDVVVCHKDGRIGEVAGTLKIAYQLLYIVDFYDRVDPRDPVTTHKEEELGRVIR